MDETAFDAFYERSFSRVVAHVYAMCGNLTEAQDCAQEAFVRAWDRRAQLDESRTPEAWVRLTAQRLAVSRWRKARRAFRQPDRALEAKASREPSPDRVALDRALAQLSEAQRHVLVLHHLQDMSVAEIAEEVGAPTGTVKARLSRGRAALAQLLTDPAPAPEARHA